MALTLATVTGKQTKKPPIEMKGCKSQQHSFTIVKEFQDFKAEIGPTEYRQWKVDVFDLIALTDHIFQPNGAPARSLEEIEVEFGFVNMIRKLNFQRIFQRLYALKFIFIWHGHLLSTCQISSQLTENNRKVICALLISKNFKGFHRC